MPASVIPPHKPLAATWQTVAASSRGLAHRTAGTANEDALLSASLVDGGLVLIAADGAGSATHGGEGARRAVESALEYFCQHPLPLPEAGHTYLNDLASWTRNKLAALAHDRGHHLRAFATTLLLALVDDRYIYAVQIGDGSIVVKNSGGKLEQLTQPYHGSYAGETIFLTSEAVFANLSFVVAPAETVSALALLTDGLETVALEDATGQPHAPFFDPLFRFVENGRENSYAKTRKLEAFLASDRVTARTHDDTTLLLAVKQ